ncbi:MAG TPA: hypothetical protein VLT36_14295 [Candidatus Dormibacteraeota bacterium]|nr:hypothetical protein [Candidatus Dormibacteraeota bacterium]
MKTTTFKFFNDIDMLRFIGQARMARLLEPYRTDLAALSLQLPPAQPETAGYCPRLGLVLAYPDALPQKLRACLLALENAASSENCCELEAAIDRSPVRNHRFHPLDRALELHFQAPELLKPFEIVGDEVTSPPPCDQSPSSSSKLVADLRSQTSPPVTNHRSLITSHDDAIQNQNSKIENSVFAHLATLSPAQYDRTRKQSARELGIRVQTLDAEVSRLRKQLVEDEMFQTALATLRSPEPWPEPVDAAELLAGCPRPKNSAVSSTPATSAALVLTVAKAKATPSGRSGPSALPSSPASASSPARFTTAPSLSLSPKLRKAKSLIVSTMSALKSKPNSAANWPVGPPTT